MEKISNQTFNIKLTVITPTFIGAGGDKDWKSGVDYIQMDGKVCVLDIEKMVKNHVIDEEKLAALFVKGGKEAAATLSSLIKSKPATLECSLRYKPFDSPIDKETKKDIRSYEIKSFIRSQFHNVPLIPGSSLKGAIRSVLFKYLREKETKDVEVFGNFKNGCDFMRFIQVGDTEINIPNHLGNNTVILNTKIFNLQGNGKSWSGGWKHAFSQTDKFFKPIGFNTLYECVAPGTSGSLVIALKKNAIDLLPIASKAPVLYKEAKKDILSDITNLFEIINEHTKAYLRKELDFFQKYSAGRTDEINKNIEDLLQRIPEDNNSCLLKMSAGSGFHSITGDWKYEDYDDTGFDYKGKKRYKSRKIVEYNGRLSLMGFIELRVEK